MEVDIDKKILRLCRTPGTLGFEEGFRLLYDRYKDLVYRVSFRITCNSADALDAAQESFILVYKNLNGFNLKAKLSSWLYRIAVNSAIDICRKRKRKESCFVDILDQQNGLFVEGNSMKERGDQGREDLFEFQRILSILSPKLRVVVVLRYLENLSYYEVAEMLSLPVGTVKSRLSRAHLAIGSYLKSRKV